MKKGIIFDMDGTLWDSSTAVADCWSKVAVANGLAPITQEKMSSVMGLTMEKLAAKIFDTLSLEDACKMMDKCVVAENEYLTENGACLYPNLIDTLETLSQTYSLYIVSNCQSGYIEAFLSYYKIGHLFEGKICYGDNGFEKGDNINYIKNTYALTDAIYVGDIQADLNECKRVGCKFIHAKYGFGTLTPEDEANYPAIESFSQLPLTLQEIQF